MGAAISYRRAHDAQVSAHGAAGGCGPSCFRHPSRNVYGWQLARYELPVKEWERKVGNRFVTEITVGDAEKLAYVHQATGKRVEFTRPRLDNVGPVLDEARAKWECELAFAEEATVERKRREGCVIGHIQLPRTNREIVAAWNRRAATEPSWVRYPTKLHTPGAFGRAGNHMDCQ